MDIENESDPNYTPDYYMGASGYIQDSGQLPDSSGIVDIKMIGLKMREGLDKESEEEMKESGGPHHSHFESSVTIGDEALRGGPLPAYTLPFKYKLVIATLLALCGIFVVITIV